MLNTCPSSCEESQLLGTDKQTSYGRERKRTNLERFFKYWQRKSYFSFQRISLVISFSHRYTPYIWSPPPSSLIKNIPSCSSVIRVITHKCHQYFRYFNVLFHYCSLMQGCKSLNTLLMPLHPNLWIKASTNLRTLTSASSSRIEPCSLLFHSCYWRWLTFSVCFVCCT